MEQSNELQNYTTITAPVAITPLDLLNNAIEKGIDVAQLEKLMDMQERFEKREAKKAYDAAMAAFKADPPKILKDALVDYTSQKGRTRFKHASLANVTTTINQALAVHGLSASWRTDQNGSDIKVTCIMSHVAGHSESTSLQSQPDNSGGKNSIQAVGSTTSYLERYTLLALTGLATHDQDDDGNGSSKFITKEQSNEIYSIIEDNDIDSTAFLKFMGCESVEMIVDFKKAKAALISKIKGGNK